MCYFRYDTDQKIMCDVAGPLEQGQFLKQCKECQKQTKSVLSKFNAD